MGWCNIVISHKSEKAAVGYASYFFSRGFINANWHSGQAECRWHGIAYVDRDPNIICYSLVFVWLGNYILRAQNSAELSAHCIRWLNGLGLDLDRARRAEDRHPHHWDTARAVQLREEVYHEHEIALS